MYHLYKFETCKVTKVEEVDGFLNVFNTSFNYLEIKQS